MRQLRVRQLPAATLSVAFLLCVAGESSAQTAQADQTPEAKMTYGLKAGIDYSTLRGDFSSPLLASEGFGYYRSWVGGGIVFGRSQLRGFRPRTVRYTVEGRYTVGFTDILIDEEAGPSAGDFKNGTFALMIGIIYY